MKRILPLLVLLGGCAAPSARTEPARVGDSGAVCHADGLDDLTGAPASAALGAEALQRSGARSLRWIQPGMAVTMDYRRDRLNVHLDAGNVVTRVNCG